MAPCTHRNQQPLGSNNGIGTSQTANNALENAPDLSMNDTVTDIHNQLGDYPRHELEEPDNLNTHVKNLENDLKSFRTEFSDFHLENASKNIQADLDNMHRAHILMNETLMSRMDTFETEVISMMERMDTSNKGLRSQTNEL